MGRLSRITQRMTRVALESGLGGWDTPMPLRASKYVLHSSGSGTRLGFHEGVWRRRFRSVAKRPRRLPKSG